MKTASEPRFASLTAGLLARKGHAKPAMRAGGTFGSGGVDDLGWNDMGAPAPAPALPEPVRQQAEIAASFAVPAGSVALDPSALAALPAGTKKAAFTLRLAPERHLRLRLACAVTHKSAQALVTEALDALLNAMPALDALADACPAAVPGETI